MNVDKNVTALFKAFISDHDTTPGPLGSIDNDSHDSDCIRMRPCSRTPRTQDDPRSQLQGIEATPSRLGGGLHLPRAGRSRLASLLRG